MHCITSHLKPQGKKAALLGHRKAAPFNSNIMFKNKMKKLLPSIVFILLLSPHVSVASMDDVNGAFGLRFGQPVPKGIRCNLSSIHLTSDCYLKPPIPYVAFDSYRVNTAELGGERVIYGIYGYKDMQNKNKQCYKEAEYIAAKLNDKYNLKLIKEPVKYILDPNKQGGTMWMLPNKEHSKRIYVTCRKVVPGLIDESKSYYQLSISYTDDAVHNKAVMEKINYQENVDLSNIKNSNDAGL